jgi:nicotinate-nucleotide adenylyltransferase
MDAIGIMGGTFDPIHWGHLILAEQAAERFGFGKVLFVTAGQPPHKCGDRVTDAVHRYEMTRLAIEDNDRFERSSIEVDRQGPSYTVDTVTELASTYPNTKLYVLIGADEARDLAKWRDPQRIQTLATIVVANRSGCSVAEAIRDLPVALAEKIELLTMPGVDISSTDLRERVRSGRSIRYLTPRAVENYILENGLYGGDQ